MSTRNRTLAGGIAAAFLAAAAGCTTHAQVYEAPPQRRDVVVVQPQRPQPRLEPAYGYQRPASYRYYYYPEAETYYLIDGGTYYWYEGNSWQSAAEAPANLRVNLVSPVVVELAGNNPSGYHEGVRVRYPHHGGHGATYRLQGREQTVRVDGRSEAWDRRRAQEAEEQAWQRRNGYYRDRGYGRP